MTKHNPANERIKREYLAYLAQAKGRNTATIDGVAASLASFEKSTRCQDFKRFHRKQAVAFKEQLSAKLNERTGERLGKSTMLATRDSSPISDIPTPTISTSATKMSL
jgi:hypothetical protein